MSEPLLDRKRELEILTYLAKSYPNKVSAREVAGELSEPMPESCDEFVAEAQYLAEHKLVDLAASRVADGLSDTKLLISAISITARGMDFLKDDGGLSAILGVVTVKLHDDTIKTLLINKVNSSDGEGTAKEQVISAIKSLPAEATKSVAMRLIGQGIESVPAKLAELQKLIGL